MTLYNIPENPDLDNFASRLFKYLQDHNFQGEINYDDILEQADRAYNTMYDSQLGGRGVTLSLEIANDVLFENVGESEYEVVAQILRDNFYDTIDLSIEEAVEYWTLRILDEIEDLFDECEKFKFGISTADVDINRDRMIGRIVTFFESYGLQQTSDIS